ncbi:DUF2339 domain-containing protein [Jannaschia sp. CCS1]|uniref:DUF2339 domain-containing protein n=1 Tax=Jannaschia sp. (strain CCS1) TaxID=290400 RepID=UPI000053BC0A|nr:DUF2339 domain-containing protein [Jannaschia sp. CCS1]ABD55531.1 membrane protein-like protein [Jannaschia sp. CCS1]
MESLLLLAGLIAVGLPIAVIYLLVAMSGAKARIGVLEAKLAHLADASTDAPDAERAQDTSSVAPSSTPVPPTQPPPAQAAPSQDPVSNRAWSGTTSANPLSPGVPDPEAVKPGAEPDEAQHVPRAVVFRQDRFAAAGAWLRDNWFLAVAAISLALAGIFLVQYGVENGLLTPFWRVMGAIALGLALVTAGEVTRRRFGDDAPVDGAEGRDAKVAFLPSTFAGAGLIVLFSAVLAAAHLYGMIGDGATFAWLIVVAALSVVLGWFYGPFLTLVGIVGALLAPFLVGGSSDTPQLFYLYFGIVAVVALLIDAVRRWAWVSVLGLVGAFATSTYIFSLGAGDVEFLAFSIAMVFAAVILPPLKLSPGHSGSMVAEALARTPSNGVQWPEFPTRLAFGTIAAATGAALLVAANDLGETEVTLALGAIFLIFALVTLWSRKAVALSDGALFALPAIVAVVALQATGNGTLFAAFRTTVEGAPDASPAMQATLLTGLGAALSFLALRRGLMDETYPGIWLAGSAIAAPLVVLVLESQWHPADILGAYPWALHAMAIAAGLVMATAVVARRDHTHPAQASYFALAATVMITLSLVLVVSLTALTLAIAALVLASSYADRRFNLPYLGVFVIGGALAIGWRLVVDPGFMTAFEMPYWEIALVYLGSIGALAASHTVLASRDRWQPRIVVSSAAWLAVSVFVSVLLWKWMKGFDIDVSRAFAGLTALVWLSSAAVQLWRLQIGGHWLWRIRLGLAGVTGLIGLGWLGWAVVVQNPLTTSIPVRGPWIFDTLLVAYVLPAIPFVLIAWRYTHLPRLARMASAWVAAGLGGFYVALEIRRFWQGDILSGGAVRDAELYSYTIALLLTSVIVLFIAFLRRSHLLRRVAIAGIALTIAKVFLIDMSGLTGLLRVVSFLGLGLSMAGLAWIVRVMNDQWETPDTTGSDNPNDG